MKDCGVAGSSVVLKSEFTTHTKKTLGEENYTKTITTQNEGTCDTIDSTNLSSIIAIV